MVEGIAGFDLLLVGAVWVLAMLASTVLVTLAYALYVDRRERRNERVTEAVRTGVFDRLGRDVPGWTDWVDTLDDAERRALRAFLRDHLDMVKGTEARKLQSLGRAMGLDEWARDLLTEGYPHQRLLALDWLALLGTRVPPSLLVEKCIGVPELEAAAAQLLFVDDPNADREPATDLLLTSGTPLSVRGMDALYRLYELDPGRLLEYAADRSADWEPRLVAQVLEVLAQCSTVDPDTPLEWLVAQVEHDDPAVRTATLAVLRDYDWRPDVRSAVDLNRVTTDPAASVRTSAYRLIGAWGGEDSLAVLRAAVRTEPNDRARIEGVRVLVERGDRQAIPTDPTIDRAQAWVEANAALAGP